MKKTVVIACIVVCVFLIFLSGCLSPKNGEQSVPHVQKWGIYALDFETDSVSLIYSSNEKLTNLRLNQAGERFVFSQRIGGDQNENEEICTIKIDGTGFNRLTNNSNWDIYPAWSPDNSEIAYLSFRDDDLDIYVMNSDGSNQHLLFDSGGHDADIHWIDNTIVFTSNSSIWKINEDGTEPNQLTFPPKAGEWGNANLPFGDYDPQLSPDGKKVAFERLENDTSQHGNYNIFVINVNGSGESRLTSTYYSQGFPCWSHDGEKILFVVSAIDNIGKYDLYQMNADGSNIENITPSYFPNDFLCYAGEFSPQDEKIYFVGEWWD